MSMHGCIVKFHTYVIVTGRKRTLFFLIELIQLPLIRLIERLCVFGSLHARTNVRHALAHYVMK